MNEGNAHWTDKVLPVFVLVITEAGFAVVCDVASHILPGVTHRTCEFLLRQLSH
jgi:hypothetical protein